MVEERKESSSELTDRVRELCALYSAPSASVAQLLCDGHDPDRVVFRIIGSDFSARDLTCGELRAQSERFAAALRALGIVAGDRVATLMGKSREYLIALMGIWRLGAVHVPLFTAFAPPAIALRLQGSGARLIVCDATQESKLNFDAGESLNAPFRTITTGVPRNGRLGFHDLLSEFQPGTAPAASGGNAPMIHIYTSGTTGRPKGVVVPLAALGAFQAYMEFGLNVRANDIYWCAADPGWAYGLYYGIIGPLLTGVQSLLMEGGFSAQATLEVLACFGVTNFAAAPTVYRALRAVKAPSPNGLRLRCASSAGEPLTPDVNEWAVSALGVPVHDHYGQTETGMLINNHHHRLLRRPLENGSMGQIMPGWRAAILKSGRDEPAEIGEAGRLAIDLSQSPLNWFKGYVDDLERSAEKFSANGRWYLTGDAASMDGEGYVYFSSRGDDVIIMAGYRIGPFEVESVLAKHPAVGECAVIAAPDEVRGEVIEAYVVLCEGIEASDELAVDIQQWVKSGYAAHAYPRAVHFVERLPKTPSGKIQRFVLREQRRNQVQIDNA